VVAFQVHIHEVVDPNLDSQIVGCRNWGVSWFTLVSPNRVWMLN